jgi:hypothetical protein
MDVIGEVFVSEDVAREECPHISGQMDFNLLEFRHILQELLDECYSPSTGRLLRPRSCDTMVCQYVQ